MSTYLDLIQKYLIDQQSAPCRFSCVPEDRGEIVDDLGPLLMGCVYGGYDKDGNLKKHPHQRRLSNEEVMDPIVDRLLNDKVFEKCFADFDDLYRYMKTVCDSIKGAGELSAYDIAVRIGKVLNPVLEPQKLYLHAGTKEGYENLVKNPDLPFTSFNSNVGEVIPASVPWKDMFGTLTPAQAEDFLCIYKSKIKNCKLYK